MSHTLVKVCGVVDPANARLAAEMGAAFIGLNFYRPSPRYVESGRAREIAEAVRSVSRQDAVRSVSREDSVRIVGVFVNASASEIEEIDGRIGLDLIQLSGDETPGLAAPFAARSVKAFRTGGEPAAEDLAVWGDTWRDAWGWLFDAPHGSLYGGTGEGWAYGGVARLARERRIFLAGGLGPDNVRGAIEASRPFAVDVCSRVESAPGIKDPELLRRLFEEVRNAEI